MKRTEQEELQIAIELIGKGKLSHSQLESRGVPKSRRRELIAKAEAAFVNNAMAMFPRPSR